MCCPSKIKQYYFVHKDNQLFFPVQDMMKYSMKEISDKLETSVDDVFNQLNKMIKESKYTLFRN